MKPVTAVGLILCFAVFACREVSPAPRSLTASMRASEDTLAIEMAVAQHFKPWLNGKTAVLDSRYGGSPKNAERPSERTHELARILAVPVAHSEDVFGCKANCAPLGEHHAMWIGQPAIKGDTARLAVGTYGVSGTGRAALCYGESELVTKTNGAWTFTRTVAVEVC